MTYQGRNKIGIEKFLELAGNIPIVDVRSPGEFNTGHIPGAFNIPLFNDKERETVGIRYKNSGRTKAILAGLQLSAPTMASKLEGALKIAEQGKLLVHCWRGGMRSEAMAWLFSLGDIETEILQGGYKTYRHLVLDSLSINRKMIILGGLTGSGKTEILKYFKTRGLQIIDLEGLANHKGSAFGSLGQLPQPSSEHFSNLLFSNLNGADHDQKIWVEDESRNIGTVFIPEMFYLNMQDNPAIVLLMDVKTRLPRLMEEYSTYSKEELKASVLKISKRLGGDNTREALNSIEAGDFASAIEITLNYYDKAYLWGLKRKHERNIYYVHTDTDNIEINALKILEIAGSLIC